MSYRFDRIVAIQTAFESTEQLFITFLESIIKFIIEPFRDHYNKFHNTPKSQLDELNRVFILIENLCKYHQESKIKLSITLDGGSSSKYDDNTNNIQSPPPNHSKNKNKHQRSSHFRNNNSKGSMGTISNLSPKIFEYYQLFPQIYQKYFNQIINSLQALSQIIGPRTNMKKWLCSKCRIIQSLNLENQTIDNNNNNKYYHSDDEYNDKLKSYESFAEILCDTLTHWIIQSNKLNTIATSKFLLKDTKAQIFRQNWNDYLVDDNNLIIFDHSSTKKSQGIMIGVFFDVYLYLYMF